MMQEMYDWYMDNLFPEHRRQAVKHAEKDGRDRKKRLAQGPSISDKAVPTSLLLDEGFARALVTWPYDRSRYSGKSKWERIGSPLTASVVDWAVIINPYTPPRMKWKAVSRQYDRFQEYS
jgi:hypothetical protein